MRIAVALGLLLALDAFALAEELATRRRRPAALVATADRLFVANRRSGSIGIVDVRAGRVTGEVDVAQRLSHLVAVPGSPLLLAADEAGDAVLVLRPTERGIEVAASRAVASTPVNLAVSPSGTTVAVASLWSRRLTLLELEGNELKTRAVLDLPFAPREQCFAPDSGRLIVADAFGGRFAVVDPHEEDASSAVAFRELDAHNVRGLAFSPDGKALYVAHQIANDLVPTRRQRVFWGAIVGNQLRRIPLGEFFRPKAEGGTTDARRIGRFELFPLGRPEDAAGDPSALAVTSDGTVLVTTAGTDELHVRRDLHGEFTRVSVGRRPTAVALSPDEKTAYVANTLDDTIGVVDVEAAQVTGTISLGPSPEPTRVDRGERLFFDSRLSLNGWYSCHGCHTDGHTNGRLIDNLSDGSEGTPKLTPTLLGTGETRPWAWNGRADFLEKQVHASILKTMQGEPENASDENVRAIAAYLRTLRPPPSITEARGTFDRDAFARGQAIFDANGCAHCHMPLKYTSEGVRDVGLEDEAGERYFNPPSLRGVSQRERFYHDGRAETLRAVFTTDPHADLEPLSDEELEALLEFLRGL